MNITKFGAFVNILPGRDGLLHISKLGRGKRIDRVEDVLNLGDEVTVQVDDIDNSGKLLALARRRRAPAATATAPVRRRWRAAGAERAARRAVRAASDRERAPVSGAAAASGRAPSARCVDVASFDEFWDAQAKDEFGDLGPAEAGRPGGDRGGRRGGSGGGRRPRRRRCR